MPKHAKITLLVWDELSKTTEFAKDVLLLALAENVGDDTKLGGAGDPCQLPPAVPLGR